MSLKRTVARILHNIIVTGGIYIDCFLQLVYIFCLYTCYRSITGSVYSPSTGPQDATYFVGISIKAL